MKEEVGDRTEFIQQRELWHQKCLFHTLASALATMAFGAMTSSSSESSASMSSSESESTGPPLYSTEHTVVCCVSAVIKFSCFHLSMLMLYTVSWFGAIRQGVPIPA